MKLRGCRKAKWYLGGPWRIAPFGHNVPYILAQSNRNRQNCRQVGRRSRLRVRA